MHRKDKGTLAHRAGQILAALIAALAVVTLGSLGTAFADTPAQSVPITSTIPSADQLTINTSSLNLSGNAGADPSATLTWQAQSNNQDGAVVYSWTSGRLASGSNSISSNDLFITAPGQSRQAAGLPGGAGLSVTEFSSAVPFNTGPETDTYDLTIPATQAAGNYTGLSAAYELIDNP